MILHSLIQYYDRLKEAGRVPSRGFSEESLGFSLTLNKSGDMVGDPLDLRNKLKANVYEYFSSIVPYTNEVNVRAGGGAATTPNFMVDKADYIFGMSGNALKESYHTAFRKLVEDVCGNSDDPGAVAVKGFFNKWKPQFSTKLAYWNEMSGPNGKWIAFQLEGERGFIHERPVIKRLWENYIGKKEYPKGVSLISGSEGDSQRQYSQFKFGSGASLVSFNEKAYESYGKERGENAPIHVDEEFKSATALKYLLNSKSQRLKIGDATTVFWTERDSPVEAFMGMVLNPQNDTMDNQQVEQFLDAARNGKKPQSPEYDGSVKFYILGVSLNKARLALRFWHVCEVDQLKDRIGLHFKQIEMERSYEKDLKYPGVWHLLKETARETKDISPVLGGALMRSIMEGTLYPLNLYNGVFNRIRADKKINYTRAAICRAVLTRNFKMEVPMSLDKENHDIAYLLGRLFAVLEKAQLDALGKINATIKDRFFGAASATPESVFPRLLRMAQHHINKAEFGYVSDRRIQGIMEHINVFPRHMDLKQQGMFAIAYYHQKNELYRKQSKEETEKHE